MMIKRFQLLNLPALFMALCAALFFLPVNTFSQSYADAETIAKLDAVFADWDSSDTPGCAVGVTHEGRMIAGRAYGMADLENPVLNTPATIFEAGSVSKQFVAGAIILLAMEDKVSLEDDVREVIPELPDYGHTITWRHLLNHTSGLRDWGSVTGISGWGRSGRTHNHDHVIDILSRQTHLNFPPGERYSYSNSGYNLLAIGIERISGMSFADFSDKYIFDPLGMTSTQWRDDYTRIVKGRSSAYTGRAGSDHFSINRPIEHVHGNGGLLTTVGDLLTWSHAIQNGFFGDEFNEELLTRGELHSRRTISYASGVRVDRDHGHSQITHTGATSGYRAYLSIYPGQDLAVAILCNVTGASPGGLGSAVSEIFLDERPEEASDRDGTVQLSESQLEGFTGIWSDPRNYRPTVIELDEGVLQLSNGTELTPLSESEFRVGSSETVYRFEESGEIRVVREGYAEELLQPEEPASSNPADYSAFTGLFESLDAETEIRIELEDGKLIAHRRPASTFELEPVYENTFMARGFGLIRFEPAPSGNTSEFIYSSGRVYDLRFVRQE